METPSLLMKIAVYLLECKNVWDRLQCLRSDMSTRYIHHRFIQELKTFVHSYQKHDSHGVYTRLANIVSTFENDNATFCDNDFVYIIEHRKANVLCNAFMVYFMTIFNMDDSSP